LGVLYISAIIVHIHFQRICVTDIIMVVLRYISQFITTEQLNTSDSLYYHMYVRFL